jgi:hypothetical protein
MFRIRCAWETEFDDDRIQKGSTGLAYGLPVEYGIGLGCIIHSLKIRSVVCLWTKDNEMSALDQISHGGNRPTSCSS